MVDNTAVARIKRQRKSRAVAGWELVSVWVPSSQDANDIKQMAAERRTRAERLAGLSKEVKSVSLETEKRIARAIAEHGSAAYVTPSGPVLDLMTKLSDEDDLAGFSHAIVMLARAKPPAVVAFVTGMVPAKISNFLIRHRGVRAEAFLRWTQENPKWTELLKNSVGNAGRFEQVVEDIAREIRNDDAH